MPAFPDRFQQDLERIFPKKVETATEKAVRSMYQRIEDMVTAVEAAATHQQQTEDSPDNNRHQISTPLPDNENNEDVVWTLRSVKLTQDGMMVTGLEVDRVPLFESIPSPYPVQMLVTQFDSPPQRQLSINFVEYQAPDKRTAHSITATIDDNGQHVKIPYDTFNQQQRDGDGVDTTWSSKLEAEYQLSPELVETVEQFLQLAEEIITTYQEQQT